VFSRTGFHEAKISEIAKEAGVAYGSFYTYFDSKEAVFYDVVMEVHREAFTITTVRHEEDEDATPLQRIEATNSHAYIHRTEVGIKRWQREGIVDPALDASSIAHALGCMVERLTCMMAVFGEGPRSQARAGGVERSVGPYVGTHTHSEQLPVARPDGVGPYRPT
jgi:AcrR family transcriptional regulator